MGKIWAKSIFRLVPLFGPYLRALALKCDSSGLELYCFEWLCYFLMYWAKGKWHHVNEALILQSNQVRRTPQDNINELIIWILNPLYRFKSATINWLFEHGTRQPFQECNNGLIIIWILNLTAVFVLKLPNFYALQNIILYLVWLTSAMG